MESLEATHPLYDAIKSYKVMSVDDYQRPFSWGNDEIVEFFQDLRECADSGEPHFFGTLILQSDPNDPSKVTIVDGQQRLTTCFITVAALRDAIDALGMETIKAEKENMRDTNVKDIALDFLNPTDKLNVYRFQSSSYIRKILFSSVFANSKQQKQIPLRDTENKQLTLAFRNAVRTIRGLVREELDNFDGNGAKLYRIYELLTALTERFSVLKLTTKDTIQSLEIFLTLNNRGLPLGPSDLVRGQVMSNLGNGKSEAEQREIQQRVFEEWSAILENVGEPEVFLRHYLVATSDEKIQKKKIVRFVERRIGDKDPDIRAKKTDQFWQDLIVSSSFYGQIVDPRMGGDTQYHIELLEGYVKSPRIVLLEILRKGFDENLRDEFVRLIFVLAFRWVMGGGNAQKLEDYFQNICVELRRGDDPAAIQAAIRERIAELDFDSARYFSNDADGTFASKAVLHYVNKKIAHGANPIPISSKSLHLEHVAPKTMTEEWVSSYFEGDKERYENYGSAVTEIGNLTLLDPSINIKLSNDLFPKKRENYKKSVMDITRDLEEFNNWNAELVSHRTKWLAEAFDLIWSPKRFTGTIDRFSTWYKKNA